jgi:signal transduction histidine kinase
VNPSWQQAEDASVLPSSDFASEVLWKTGIQIAVFDHAGHLVFANPSFRDSQLAARLLDARGFVKEPAVERLRLEVMRHRGPNVPAGLEVDMDRGTAGIELFGLGLAPGWTALTASTRNANAQAPPDLPDPQLLLHELRAPMLGLREGLDTLTDRCAELAPELLDAIGRQSRALSRMAGVLAGLGDLLRAGDVSARRSEWQPVDLARVVRTVEETFSGLAAASGHELAVEVDSGISPVRGDEELLVRAIANLVDNALKYSPPPGPVRLGLHLRGALAVLEVSDLGPGIAPADRRRIFDPFVRLPSALSTGAPGSGLGLAVVQRVATAHGGSLSFESELNLGTTFRLSFLVAQPTVGDGRQGAGIGAFDSR